MKTERENVDVYQIVTDRVVELLEAGTVPWNKPWVGGANQTPKNLASGKPYRGINLWLLGCASYSSPYWVSYKQAQERGGQVKKGEKSSLVTFWKMFESEKDGEKKTIPMLRYYRVFNVQQCDGLEYPKEELPTREFNTIEECERIVSGMPKAPVLTHEEQRAYYQRNADKVNMPKKETFDTAENYYATLFHELTHSTGHESRLGRMQEKFSHFGDTTYAKEELIAEMGASFLCNVAGIMDRTIDNSASYINSWLKALKNDRKLVVSASSKAQEAAEFILGKTKED
jgi:antirestriction protein ArdC